MTNILRFLLSLVRFWCLRGSVGGWPLCTRLTRRIRESSCGSRGWLEPACPTSLLLAKTSAMGLIGQLPATTREIPQASTLDLEQAVVPTPHTFEDADLVALLVRLL